MSGTDDVTYVVVSIMAELAGIDSSRIKSDDRLLQDLGITGDDLTFVFVPSAERKLGVRIAAGEWGHVSTVGDAIYLLSTAALQGRTQAS